MPVFSQFWTGFCVFPGPKQAFHRHAHANIPDAINDNVDEFLTEGTSPLSLAVQPIECMLTQTTWCGWEEEAAELSFVGRICLEACTSHYLCILPFGASYCLLPVLKGCYSVQRSVNRGKP